MIEKNKAAIFSNNDKFISKYTALLSSVNFQVKTKWPTNGRDKFVLSEFFDCYIIDNTKANFPYSKFLFALENHKTQIFLINIGQIIPEQIENPYLIFNIKNEYDEINLPTFLKNAALVLQRDKAQAELASMLVHDIRSPLNSLIGYLELLINGTFGPIGEGHKNILEKAMEMGDTTLDLLEDLNEVFQNEQNTFVLRKEPFNLSNLIESVLLNVWVKADKKNIQIKKNISTDIEYLLGEDFQIQRLLTNLMVNAIKYSPKNSKIIIKAKPIENDSVEISVSDNGEGVPENELPHLFDKYFRVKQTTKIKKGYGLGLYICKIIILAHDGTIRAENNDAGGLTVTFTLPKATKPVKINTTKTYNRSVI